MISVLIANLPVITVIVKLDVCLGALVVAYVVTTSLSPPSFIVPIKTG